MRLYLDTSVYGGYFEPEFEKWTRLLFERIRMNRDVILFSSVVTTELEGAPAHVQELLVSIPTRQLQLVELDEAAIELADAYLAAKVVGRTSLADCRHIAMATLARANALVSWNFKHIVSLERIYGYNSVNLRSGYPMLEIRSPIDLMSHG